LVGPQDAEVSEGGSGDGTVQGLALGVQGIALGERAEHAEETAIDKQGELAPETSRVPVEKPSAGEGEDET
jgi:hypothetical protein